MKTVSFAIVISLFFAMPVISLTLDEKLLVLDKLEEFAHAACIPQGNRSSAEVKVDISAKSQGLLDSLISISPNLSGNYKTEEYEGLLQSQIVGKMLDQANCYLEVTNSLKADLFAS